ncbi:hypothetical protein [Roseicyclus marinus]|uniref:hypothetical protein n=1 Tax=Roseicyclus marinus TaxID=2161673 RepID=UPI0024104DFC|nr:hypothetical protein [Roseicyclus marinus]MDG3042763.1 hypothetical protein [Roseicyclus marinus]
MIYILGAVYIALCIPVAIVGTGSRLGFFGTFLFSLLLTPLLMIFLLIMLTPRKRKVAKRGSS